MNTDDDVPCFDEVLCAGLSNSLFQQPLITLCRENHFAKAVSKCTVHLSRDGRRRCENESSPTRHDMKRMRMIDGKKMI